MKDSECIAFLQWALPRLGLRWQGYRKVRAQVCKRVDRRRCLLGLADTAAYRGYLESHPAEWSTLELLCAIPISRFYRDRSVFDALETRVLPALARSAIARGATRLRCWSAGCASGEEPHTLAIIWHLCLATRFPELALDILATDLDPILLERARTGCYGRSSLAELPPEWIERAFERSDGLSCLRAPFRRNIDFELQDLRRSVPAGRFDLVLCRNLAFTYFEAEDQSAVLQHLSTVLRPEAVLVIGLHEHLPSEASGFVAWPDTRAVYRRSASEAFSEELS